MITLLPRHAVALVASLAISLPAAATSYSTDYTDLWWSGQAESGWGLNLIQLHNVMFGTLFVYHSDNSAKWYSASDLSPVGGSTTLFSGQLIETRGPWLGASTFDPNLVTRSTVGAMTISFSGPNTGTLQYSVNGVQVTKQIQRINGRTNNLAGIYIGGMLGRGSCGQVATFDNLTVTQSDTAVTMKVDYFQQGGTPASCTYSGTLGTIGRLSSISNGTYSCTVNNVPQNNGAFTLNDIDVGRNGFHGTFSGQDQFCTGINGRFGGVRDVP